MTKGKFRKETSAAQQKRKTILQTYLTSLVSLVLCVTMFFGTTAAWFTDTVETNQNQMYVGTLEVELKHGSYKNGQLGEMAVVDKDHKVFDSKNTWWEPGYTAVEKFELTENGTLAFGYNMTMAYNFSEDAETKAKEEAFTKAVDVWTYTGENAATYVLPANYEDMIAEGWTKVGSLHDVLTKTLSLFSGEMDSAEVNKKKTVDNVEQDDPAVAEHIIALHLDEDFTGEIVVGEENKTVQGLQMKDITIKLVATQMSSENDAFGPTYDLGATYTEVIYASSEEELREALTNAENGSVVVLTNDVQLDPDNTITVASGKDVTIDLNGKMLSGVADGTGNREMFLVKGKLTVKNGAMEMSATQNQGWDAMTTLFDVTDGGVLNIENATIKNLGGSDMGFCVHLNNWGEVTLNAKNTTFKSNYVAVRVFNSGNDMNNVTLEKCHLEGSSAALWVHNYTAADFSNDQNKAETQKGLLNFTLSGNTYIGNSEKAGPIRLGMTDATYVNEEELLK